MNLLNDPLVRKYFGCVENAWCGTGASHDHFMYMSQSILSSMQEPIKKGERYLDVTNSGQVAEFRNDEGIEYAPFHPNYLRLPDYFQMRPDLVEDKIKAIVASPNSPTKEEIEKLLRELVDLVKKTS